MWWIGGETLWDYEMTVERCRYATGSIHGMDSGNTIQLLSRNTFPINEPGTAALLVPMISHVRQYTDRPFSL